MFEHYSFFDICRTPAVDLGNILSEGAFSYPSGFESYGSSSPIWLSCQTWPHTCRTYLSRCRSQIYYWPAYGPVLFCMLSSVGVVCNARGRSAAAGPSAWPVRRPTLHGGTVRLRPVRATPCYRRGVP